MSCIEKMDHEILLANSSFKEAKEFIKKNFKEVYYVDPGYKLFDIYMIGISDIPIAVDEDYLVFPYTKPCHGTFVLKIKGDEELSKLKSK
ncbi:MAG TPA: DUF1894 domain-containing protein [Halobacteria archaeon]|nr:DUF1894 domain-containing protein [Halobacteria archaeon]HIH77555.1 DUF1894 domain-containing protein [Halobacteria archaeon]